MKNTMFAFVSIILSILLLSTPVALYEQGKALREEGKQVEAMQAFIEAAHSGTGDEALLGRVWSNMANMCRQANDHQTAFEVYTLSAEHFRKAADTLAYAYALNNMAWEQAVMGNKDEARTLVDSAMRCYPKEPLTNKIIETQAAACLFAKEYDSVLVYTTPPANDYLLTLRAQAYSYLQMDDSATYYAQLLLPQTTNLFALDDLYYILTHNDSSADKETLRSLASLRADTQNAIKARHGELVKAVEMLKQDLVPQEKTKPWKIILLVVLGVGLLAWAALVAKKQHRLHTQKSQFEQTRRFELEQNIRHLQETEDLRQELAWTDFQSFCTQIDKRFNAFAAKLQEQGLNEQDIRICVLVLIGLSHKQIAEILNCSPKSIGKLKDLTAHKLGVSGGQLQEKLLKTAIL
ncbi:MAG: tetratricopeptide repeat protein [Paludibacteraceae bacterium]|nr:tetratricopeptide repeat protein [Paludibacteraceae bacterium]